jgi:hypothetical protein
LTVNTARTDQCDLKRVEKSLRRLSQSKSRQNAGDPEDSLCLHPRDFPRIRLKQLTTPSTIEISAL